MPIHDDQKPIPVEKLRKYDARMNNLDKYGVLIILAAGAIGVFVPFAAEPFFDMTPAEASDLTSTWILITAAIGLALVFYKHGYASGKAIMRAGLPSNGP